MSGNKLSVKTTIKEHAKPLKLASDVQPKVEQLMRDILERAKERATMNGRTTLMAKDI